MAVAHNPVLSVAFSCSQPTSAFCRRVLNVKRHSKYVFVFCFVVEQQDALQPVGNSSVNVNLINKEAKGI